MLSHKLQKALCANNQSSLAKDETSGHFTVICIAQFENKNDKKNKNDNLKMVLVLQTHTSVSVLSYSIILHI